MKLLILSTDSQIFNEGSAVRDRILEYGKLFDELKVIVYTKPGKKEEKLIGNNITLIPTNNRFRLGYFRRAICLGKMGLETGDDWIISSQDPFETGLVGWRLKKKFNVFLQIQIHTDFLSPWFWRESLKNKLRVLLANFLVLRADKIRVVSERIKKSLIALNPDLEKRILVLPIFVDKDKFATAAPESRKIRGINEDDFLIVTASRAAKEKNMNLANDIIGELKRRGHKVKWLHIGYVRGGADMSLENLLVVAPFYKMANLFLLTSNYEGYGMAVVEAAAAGVPVVMTDVGVALGATFPIGDKDKAVGIIENLIKDPGKRTELVVRQNAFFKNWPTKEEYLEKFKQGLTF